MIDIRDEKDGFHSDELKKKILNYQGDRVKEKVGD